MEDTRECQINAITSEIQRLFDKRDALRQTAKIAFTPDEINRMTKNERIEYTWQLPELPASMMDVVMECGFRTGSRVYGGAGDDSDHDWVVNVPPHVFEPYVLNGQDRGYWEQDGMSTVYAHIDGRLLNIICISTPDLFQAWYHATHYMIILCATEAPTNFWRSDEPNHVTARIAGQASGSFKWARVRMFRALCDAMRRPTAMLKPLDFLEATTYRKCATCGREALNFTNRPQLELYEQTGVCERCREEKVE